MGPGITGSVYVTDNFSASLDLNILPLPDWRGIIDGVKYELSPTVRGGLMLLNYHPFATKFSLGVGMLFGGYTLDGQSTENNGTFSLGNQTYPASLVGTLTGTFESNRPTLALQIGWRGKGFNASFGISPFNTSANLTASGPAGSNPVFQNDVEEEIDRIKNEIERFPLLPYIRIGYQFSL